jgi:cobyrinic acid a,c-diamide synthase
VEEGGVFLILPRLIIADEYRLGKIPSGVLIAGVLKEMGYKMKLFMGNVDEVALRALQVICGQPVTLLDPILCDGQSNLKWLFQSAASEDCINLILANLGGRLLEDSPFKVSKECLLLSEWLDCEVIPVIYSDASSTLAVRSVAEVIRQIEENGRPVHSILFRSILSNREYELLDREAGRQFTAFSIGSIPSSMERDAPPLTSMCGVNANQAILPLRSSARQLMGMDQQVNWPVFRALALAAPGLGYQPRLSEPITDSGKVNIAVVRHPALSLSGDGTEHLMRVLGCNVVDVPLEGNITHNVPIHGVYLPHGLAYTVLPKFFSNLYLKTMLTRGSTGQSFLFAEGGSSAVLGERITLPGQRGDGRGLGVLPFNATYGASTFVSPRKMAALSRKANPLITGSRELVWGYGSEQYSLVASKDEEECWNLMDSPDGRYIGRDGWCIDRILATSMRLEPWSTPETFRRWLEG